MNLIVDANILFAALIKEGITAELILNDRIQLHAPEFLFEEFMKYKDLILEKTSRNEKDFNFFIKILKGRIKIIPKQKIMPYMKQSVEISPDPKDAVYIASAIAIDAKIWSNDKRLKAKQQKIEVYSTSDLKEHLDTLLQSNK